MKKDNDQTMLKDPTNYGELVNYPNAAKLMQSLRHLDYDNVAAINDLVDNSIDAGATSVFVDIIPGSNGEIESVVVTDNGSGMEYDVLSEALRLGSETGRNPAYDLGLYGMGLLTASISMGRRLEVISKAEGSDVLIGVQDIDEIIDKNAFTKSIDLLSPNRVKEIAEAMVVKLAHAETTLPIGKTPDTFTMINVSKIDRAQKRASGLESDVKQRVGQVFRKFIQAGRCDFYVNGQKIPASDPIRDYDPTILTEETIKLDEGAIKITVTELRDYGSEINKQKAIGIPGQGFYVLRNNREIAAGETLGLFTKHNDFNLLRIEFSYPGNLDQVLNTNFSKQRIRLDQSIKDKVERICNPFIHQVRGNAKRKQRASKDAKEDFTDVEKYITQKSHLLKNPKTEVEERARAKYGAEKAKPRLDPDHPRLNIVKRHRISLEALKVRFDQARKGDKAPLWEPDQERDKVIVTWNVDHPFYQLVIGPYANEPEVFNPLAYLVYCFASAELIAREGSDSFEVLDNIRWDVGRNLAILLN